MYFLFLFFFTFFALSTFLVFVCIFGTALHTLFYPLFVIVLPIDLKIVLEPIRSKWKKYQKQVRFFQKVPNLYLYFHLSHGQIWYKFNFMSISKKFIYSCVLFCINILPTCDTNIVIKQTYVLLTKIWKYYC